MKKQKGKNESFVLDVTQKDYQKEIASGVDRDIAMKPGKYVFHRVDPGRMATTEDVASRNTKVVITLRIDPDILEFFKMRAGKRGAPGYQTQMNDALRGFMEGGDKVEFSKLLDNETFIAKVAERVRQTGMRK